MNVSGKYLKDESGQTISPVVSIDTVYLDDTKLSELVGLERTETIVGTYEEERYLYARNIVIQITPGNRVGYTVSNSDIDIKYFIGKYFCVAGYQYILPYYESSTKFCRIEVVNNGIYATTGTDTNIGQGSITGRVFYTKV